MGFTTVWASRFKGAARRIPFRCRAISGVAGAMMLASLLSGCMTFSDSLSESISKSVSSPFKWSSESSTSSASDRKEAYQGDIRTYVDLHARSGKDVATLGQGLTSIGEKYGISDWEAEMATFTGIGQGLARAAADQTTVEAYQKALSQGDPLKLTAMRKGYDQER
jgi:hypothetical protein